MKLEDSSHDDPIFFAPTRKLFQAELNPNTAGMFAWSWLKAHNMAVNYFTFPFKTYNQGETAEAFALGFSNIEDRRQYVDWYTKELRPKRFRSEWNYELYGNDEELIAWIKKSEHGYYLGSGHVVKDSDSFDLFHWIQTHVSSPVFKLSDRKLYFTNASEELEFKLSWIDETPQ